MEMGEELRDLLKEARAPRAAGAGEHERDLRGVPGVLTNDRRVLSEERITWSAGGRYTVAIGSGGAYHLDQLLDRDALKLRWNVLVEGS